MSRCANMDAFGIQRIAEGEYRQNRMERPLKELRVSGLKRVSTALLFSLARGLPGLEILDISRAKDLDDAALEAFVQWDPYLTASSTPITLTSRQMGLDPASTTSYTKRLTRLRHLSLSDCQLLTDTACGHLAYAVPLLEFFEFAGIGRGVSDVGLVRMLKSTPLIRRIDLEDASEITNAVIHAITPTLSPRDEWRRGVLIPAPPEPGEALEHIILSYATNLTADAVVGLIRACTHLRVLEVDNTPITDEVVREFVKASRKRKLKEAEVNAVDCRHVGKVVVAELGSAGMVRHRRGWRDWEARNLGYLDSRDEESGSLPGGQDECDENKVALKTFWTWQHVDSALAARDARRKTRMEREEIDAEAERWDPGPSSSRAPRWWASRRSMSVSALPGSYLRGLDDDERGCIIM
jgi:F-box/leucine-rich repeat protein 2/20